MKAWKNFTIGFIFLVGIPASAQFRTTLRDISPNQSDLHVADPDGASGGRINGLTVTPDGSTYYGASEWGGIFKSANRGRTWRRLTEHRPSATWDVAVSPTDSAFVVATSFFDGRVNTLAGINLSRNGGRAWTRVAATPPPNFCVTEARRNEPSAFGIAFDPANTQNIYVGTNCGLALTNDGGTTWRFIDPTPADLADNIWDIVVHDGIIDLVGDDGHQRSSDGGTTWTTAAAAVALPAGRGSIAVSPDESYVLIAVIGTTIFESDDGGATWPTIITNPSPQGRIPFVVTNQRTGNGFDLWFGDVSLHRATCTTPNNPTQGGAARCPQNTWLGGFTRGNGAHDDSGDLVFDPTTTVDACPTMFSSDGGVYFNTLATSPNCQTPQWNQPNITPHGLWLWTMAGAERGGIGNEDLYFGAQDNGAFGSTNAQAQTPTWNNEICCDGFHVAADPNRVLFTLCCFGGGRATRLFTANPGMTSPVEVNTYPAGQIAGFQPSSKIASAGGASYLLITTRGVFFTANITANPIVWTAVGNNAPAAATNIKVSNGGGTATVFVQAGVGDGRSRDQLWFHNNTGAAGAWTQINPPGATGGFGIYDVDPQNPDRIIASHLRQGQDPQMIISWDRGVTWRNLPTLDDRMTGSGTFLYTTLRGPTDWAGFNGYPQPSMVAFHPQDSNFLVAGGIDSGIFLSGDAGSTWSVVSDPNNPSVAKPFVSRPRFAYFEPLAPTLFFRTLFNVYIGTQGMGVWRLAASRFFRLETLCENYLCKEPFLDRGVIVLECPGLGRPPCVFRDPLPKNCLIKFDCPYCRPNGLCPPFFHIFLDDFDPRLWEVAIVNNRGELADYEIFPRAKGVVLSFRPDKEFYVDGSIGKYELVFASKPDQKIEGKFTIRTSLKVSDRHYSPDPNVKDLSLF